MSKEETLLTLKYGSLAKAHKAWFGRRSTSDDRWEIACIRKWLLTNPKQIG